MKKTFFITISCVLLVTVEIVQSAEFQFICPEKEKSDKARKQSFNKLWDYFAEKNPDAKLIDFINYRYKLLVKHKCDVTLDNIESNSNSSNENVKNRYICANADTNRFFSNTDAGECLNISLSEGWINFMSTDSDIVDIFPGKIVVEKNGVKIWSMFYSIYNSEGVNGKMYNRMKGISKYYCKKHQTKLIQATYLLDEDVVYERLAPEAIIEEIEPGTVNEAILNYVCKNK